MIRSALLVCVAIMLAACFPVIPPPPPSPPQPIAALSCSADEFGAKAWLLTDAAWTGPGPGANQPGSISPLPSTSIYRQSLVTVFNAAGAFAEQLCHLDRIYINAVSCTGSSCLQQSFGWLQSSNKVGQGRIVSLSTALWNEPSYSHFKAGLAAALLPPGPQVTYSNAQPVDNLTTVILAALAHEIGHIGWFIHVDSLPNPTTYCNGRFFTPWTPPVHRVLDSSNTPWREFLTLAERNRLRGNGHWLDSHAGPPHIDQIDHPLPGDPPVNKSIYGLLVPGAPWASLFAAMSPDEDFVETYKLKVLTDASVHLTSMPIAVQGIANQANIIDDYVTNKKHVLSTKTQCIPIVLF